jgi:methionyl aminopeptidase
MRIRREPEIQVKTAEQVAHMRAAGLVVARALTAAAGAVAPGVSTADLDAVAAEEIRAAGAVPSFKGYHGFPATICASVNDEIVHGIPSADRKLRTGDVVSIDCGAIALGWHADAALTVGVGAISEELARLIEACEQALWHGLAQARVGARLTDISHAVESSARVSGQFSASGGYGIVEDYVGHGIGSEMHMDPPVPNRGRPGQGPVLAEGMALAIEPLLVLGRPETVLLDDGWTVVSADGSRSAHFEHTVAITAEGPWVLTAPDGGRDRLSRLAEPVTGSAGHLADSPRPQV